MGKTMNKDDVLYRAKIATFDIREIGRISGKPINTAVRSAVDDAKKATKAGTMKDGEGKIGTIEGHLFLRIKAGSSHEDDFLLAKNFVGAAVPVVHDQAYQNKVNTYIQVRTAAYDQLVNGEKAIKARLTTLEQMLGVAQGQADEAKRGGFGMNNPGDRAANTLRQAIALAHEAEQLFQDEVHAPFETHRSFAAPDGVDGQDIAEYSKSYYLTKFRPKYGKADEYRKLCQTTVAMIRAAAKNARNFADRAGEVKVNAVSMAQELEGLAAGEVKAMTKVWGLQAVDSVQRAIEGDIVRLNETRETPNIPAAEIETLTARYLQTSNERMVAMKNSYSRLQKHVAKMGEIVASLSGIPKDQLKVAEVKEAIKAVDTHSKTMAKYVKTVEGHMKLAGTAYVSMKKEAAKV